MTCRTDSKAYCASCKHIDYCDIANRCNGECSNCDITTCENNKYYKEER